MKKIGAFALASVISVALVGIEANMINAAEGFIVDADERRPPVYLKYTGTGCKNASSVDYTDEHAGTLTISFDRFDAANPSAEAVSKLKRSSCNFAVPVHVPQGFQVSLMTSDWRGYSEGGKNALKRKYFFAGKLTGAEKKIIPKGRLHRTRPVATCNFELGKMR